MNKTFITIALISSLIIATPTKASDDSGGSAAEFFSADKNLMYNKKNVSKIKQKNNNHVKINKSSRIIETLYFAKKWEDYHAQKNRSELRDFLTKGNGIKVDPIKIPWCAAFANAVLKQSGRKGTGSLQARSFLRYGVATKYPKEGDIVVFSRGRNRHAGHVGFYKGEETIEGVKYILVFGGNQNKEVNVTHYPASKLLGYRSLG